MVAALRCTSGGSGCYSFYVDGSGLVDRIFIRDPTVWTTCTFEAFKVVSGGIVCRETGTWVPLLESGLLCYGMKISKSDIVRLLDLLHVKFLRKLGKAALLKILATQIKDDAIFVQQFLQERE